MIPVHFGSSERKLLGLYSPPRAVASGERAVVLCHPWGQEYLRAHRSMRQLASMLAGSGYHAFRFDYYGTGDSFGDSADGDLSGWMADIESAIHELQRHGGRCARHTVGTSTGRNARCERGREMSGVGQ